MGSRRKLKLVTQAGDVTVAGRRVQLYVGCRFQGTHSVYGQERERKYIMGRCGNITAFLFLICTELSHGIREKGLFVKLYLFELFTSFYFIIYAEYIVSF